MKFLIFVCLLSFGIFAQAQQQENTTAAPMKKTGSSATGIYFGTEYMNMTDFKAEGVITDSGVKREYKSESTGHAGIAGISLGYNGTPVRGLGFTAGVRYMAALNKSEMGDSKFRLTLPEVNLSYAFGAGFTGYIGANYGKVSGDDWYEEMYKSAVGGQAGLGLRFTKDLALNLGYTLIRQEFTFDLVDDQKTEAVVSWGGFSSNLTYTF